MELAAALQSVELASRVCRHVQSRLDVMRSMTKDDASPVTIADFASQAVIAHELVQAGVMHAGLVAEEAAEFLQQPAHAAHLEACVAAVRVSGAWPGATPDDLIAMVGLGAADAECLIGTEGGWTLDPVDGTKGFLRGQQYCISLCLIRRGRPELAILACPNLPLSAVASLGEPDIDGCVYTARVGGGARARALGGGAEASAFVPVRRAPMGAGHHPVLAESYESAHTDHSAAARVMFAAVRADPRQRVGEPVRMDSQAKYAVVARGQADVYLRMPSRKGYIERIWDHAAGTLVASEAGCTVTDALGAPLDFGLGRGLERNRGVIAAPPELHGCLIDAVRRGI